MEESLPSSIFLKFVIAIGVLVIFDLVFVNWWILNKANGLSSAVQNTEVVSGNNLQTPIPSPSPTDTNSGELTIDKAVDPTPGPSPTVIPTVSPTPAPAQTVVQTANKEIFVPLGTGQTRSNTFANLYGLEVNLDTTKYSSIDHVTFEAAIWAEGGNGRAWAQIINVTDNNPFIESQISNPTSTPTLKTSNYIPIPSGSKLYRVQAKSEFSDYYAHVDNAHLKITLK